MKIAVLTLTRDRLDYTKHCFAKLRELAGCDFDHFVLDQGSTDGTAEWLNQSLACGWSLWLRSENIGIHRGLNTLIQAAKAHEYDVFVKVDNDCELVTPNTIKTIAYLADKWGWLVSPEIAGLNHPPPTIAEHTLGDYTLLEKQNIGGICMAIPAWVFNGWKFDESLPPWGGDDTGICAWMRGYGSHVGYVKGYVANHYETTDGQHERYPDYFARKVAEGSPV